MSLKKTIVIAGASGFIGRHLIQSLKEKFNLICLSRSQRKSNEASVNWKASDLFSYSSVINALEGADIAIYLVHSMLPSTRLFQGNFKDTDLFIADNFARACVHHNIKQIIYLGGLVPEGEISEHLESRREVEDVFKSTGIPTTILRAGMVVGDGGSSFEILKNLVLNLPAMVLPKWTQNQTQAIYIDDLVRVLSAVINESHFFNRTINVVNGESITYEHLIKQTADYFKKKKFHLSVPINSTSFSKLWVTLFADSTYELVSPLIDSLKCELPQTKIDADIEQLIKHRNFREMLELIHPDHTKKTSRAKNQFENNTVRSIQRFKSTKSFDVDEISNLYTTWLSAHLRNLIKVKTDDDVINFYAPLISKPLLILQKQSENAELDRIKFHIVGGLLSKTNHTGWLEFRKISGGDYTLASINDFVPALPWYVYKYSQALIHLKVMKDFGDFLAKKNLDKG